MCSIKDGVSREKTNVRVAQIASHGPEIASLPDQDGRDVEKRRGSKKRCMQRSVSKKLLTSALCIKVDPGP